MLPVSPVLHTIVTVRIGLKTQINIKSLPIHTIQSWINNLTLRGIKAFLLGTRVVEGRIPDEGTGLSKANCKV